jgi:hypothetical protein
LSQPPWFRARASGLGWTPVTWQGWVVTILSALVVMAVNLAAVLHISGARH